MNGELLTGARLRLRRAAREDIPRLYEWYADPGLMPLYDGVSFPITSREDFERAYSLWLDHEVEWGLAGSFILELRTDGRAIGECSWLLIDRTGPDSPGIYHVGGLIGPADLRAKGLGTEALRLLRDYLFGSLHAHRLEAMTGAFNTGAMKTLHRNGFVREGVLREAALMNGQWQDRVMFALLRREWESGSPMRHDFPAD